MNKWKTQEIIVYLVVLGLCRMDIVAHLLLCEKNQSGKNPCDGCSSGCELRICFQKSRWNTRTKQIKTRKRINKVGFVRKPFLSLHSQVSKNGTLTEWLGSGLQNRRRQFESARYLNQSSEIVYKQFRSFCFKGVK